MIWCCSWPVAELWLEVGWIVEVQKCWSLKWCGISFQSIKFVSANGNVTFSSFVCCSFFFLGLKSKTNDKRTKKIHFRNHTNPWKCWTVFFVWRWFHLICVCNSLSNLFITYIHSLLFSVNNALGECISMGLHISWSKSLLYIPTKLEKMWEATADFMCPIPRGQWWCSETIAGNAKNQNFLQRFIWCIWSYGD